MPYAERFLCYYASSKAIAEQMVLASSSEVLKTCAIRPHLVWGPGDPHLIPRLIARGKAQKLKQVGNGQNLVDISYIDNVADGHILAAENLNSSALPPVMLILYRRANLLISGTGLMISFRDWILNLLKIKLMLNLHI